MIKKSILFFLFLYFLVLIQTSFLAHFSIFGVVLNFVLITVIIINFFTDNKWWLLSSALFAGFLLDIFSANFIGFYILILLGISIFIQLVLKNYISPVVQIGGRLKNNWR